MAALAGAIGAALVFALAPKISGAFVASTIPPIEAVVVTACGTPPAAYTAGTIAPLTMNPAGELCVDQ